MLARRVESESELSRASRDTLTSLSFFKINCFVTRATNVAEKEGLFLLWCISSSSHFLSRTKQEKWT